MATNEKLEKLLRKPLGDVTDADIIAAWEEALIELGAVQRDQEKSCVNSDLLVWASMCGKLTLQVQFATSNSFEKVELFLGNFSWWRHHEDIGGLKLHCKAGRIHCGEAKVPQALIDALRLNPETIDVPAILRESAASAAA